MAFQLETSRLTLREFSINDADDLYQLNLNPEVIKYTGDPPFKSLAEAKQFVSDYNAYRKTGYGRWAVIEKSTNKFIGWCGLKYHPEGYIDLGFRFFQETWGNGFATESSQVCIQYAKTKLNLQYLIGRVLPENRASIRVLEKLGFVYLKSDTCKGMQNALYYKLELS